ncbi:MULTISPECIES: hypothetical protein [Phyllobacterium]|uniref:Lipoprotein n=1 Tax=Phyllobacterium sophorae TaxID=1520277 RepID=A0A2P7B4D2_9HYPH|nr:MULTISPECIES: hypothetical protein [Phyllobacterium]PSH61322.1 hypothetical protein CU103_23435 [Phyllobacterium sophorae]UXN63367.1 hypothetical protein N8E89_12170 [Phyllobacterium sp. A18/5-2]
MKHRFCLLLPLILISACNGSDSKPDDSVARSTFDAVTAELKETKSALAKAQQDNADLAGQQGQIQTALDAKLAEQEELLQRLQRADLTEAERDELKRQLGNVTKERDQLIANKAKLTALLKSAVCQ